MFARALALALVAVTVVTPFAGSAIAAAPAKKPAPAAAKVPPVGIADAWIREAPPQARALGGYMRIANKSKQGLTLMGVSSPLFESVEMHVIVEEEGRLAMKQVMRLPIAGAEMLELKPRDKHLMLMRPKKQLKAGDKVPLVLDFGPAGKVHLNVEVKRPAPGPHH